MSKLKELIKEFCSDGVEYKPICQVASVRRGTRVVRSQLKKSGVYPVYQNSLKPLGYFDQSNCPAKTAFVIGAGAAGEIGYSGVDFWAADDCYYISHSDNLDSRYLYHVLISQRQLLLSNVRKASIPRLSRSVIENLAIPVPPLEVQREIVCILDNFTELTEELTEELTARKQQYEYYRDKFMQFDKDVKIKSLSEIAVSYVDGMHSLPKEVSEKGEYPILSAKNINNGNIDLNTSRFVTERVYDIENKRTNVKHGDVLLTIVGAIGRVAVVKNDDKMLFQRSVCIIKPKSDLILSDYLKYVLESTSIQDYIQSNAHGAAQKGIYLNQVGEIKIPIPSLDVQNRIVNVLNNFDSICSDFNIGLPAEIEVRKKQYEYYRDKLLSFKEINV